MSTRPAPPSGTPPPAVAPLPDGAELDLLPLARSICERYDAEFPDERERYGPAGQQWCVHDNRWLLLWAVMDAEFGTVDLSRQVEWLARVLEARDFPLDRLARDLEIAAEQLEPAVPKAAVRLDEAAARLRKG